MSASSKTTSDASPSVAAGWEFVGCPLCGGTENQFDRRIRKQSLVKCRRCGMVFANPQPTAEALAEAYNGRGDLAWAVGGRLNKLDFYQSWFGPRDRRRWIDNLERMARLAGGRGRLLEYGCGPALVGQAAAETGWQVEGIDLGAWIRELQPQRSFPLHVGTIREQRWPAGCFDAVYAQDVLEHLRSPGAEMEELARILRPGGVLYVHVPNYASLTIRLGVSRFAYNEPPGHLNYFTPATLTALLQRTGFDRVLLGSDHLEHQDFWRRGEFDYKGFEGAIAVQGRQEGGRLWAAGRAMINVAMRAFLCGTYLWGLAMRR